MSLELMMVATVNPKLGLDLMKHCERIMNTRFFSRLTLIAPKLDNALPDRVNHIECPFNAKFFFGYNVWRVRELPLHYTADFVMFTSPKAFIIHPRRWEGAFLKYDYVGAPWSTQEIGAGGAFSIRSKKFSLWAAKCEVPIQKEITEDVYLSQVIAKQAVEAGFEYAPRDVCGRFCLEYDCSDMPRTTKDVFGFHGDHILPKVMPNLTQQVEMPEKVKAIVS